MGSGIMLSCLPFGGQSSTDQLVMLGLEGAGKTTLLYSLRLGPWKEITRVIEKMNDAGEDPGYHYEEMASVSKLKKYGIWDVPGTAEMVGLWPMFYRYIKVCAILFVVDGSEEFTKREDI